MTTERTGIVGWDTGAYLQIARSEGSPLKGPPLYIIAHDNKSLVIQRSFGGHSVAVQWSLLFNGQTVVIRL